MSNTDANVAQGQITTEELVVALAIIEARKRTEPGLEATPEVILAAVQAQRIAAKSIEQPFVAAAAAPIEAVAPEAVQTDVPVVMTHCPACSRKLLSQTSAMCNWCGAKINDPIYQERAAQTRIERDEVERHQVEAVAQEEARFGVYGRLKRRAKQNPSGGSNNPLSSS